MTTMDLAAFISARLSEDEAVATAAVHRAFRSWHIEPWFNGETLKDGRTERSDVWGTTGYQVTGNGALDTVTADHIARHDPARVLREVTAKRARLAYYLQAQAKLDHIIAHPGEMSPGDQGMWLGKTAAARMACRYDAAVWADHGDYRPGWAPGHEESR